MCGEISEAGERHNSLANLHAGFGGGPTCVIDYFLPLEGFLGRGDGFDDTKEQIRTHVAMGLM